MSKNPSRIGLANFQTQTFITVKLLVIAREYSTRDIVFNDICDISNRLFNFRHSCHRPARVYFVKFQPVGSDFRERHYTANKNEMFSIFCIMV